MCVSSSALLLLFLLPKDGDSVTDAELTPAVSSSHTTCQLSLSDNMLFNEANWETSHHAAAYVCVCTGVCREHLLLAADNKCQLNPKKSLQDQQSIFDGERSGVQSPASGVRHRD